MIFPISYDALSQPSPTTLRAVTVGISPANTVSAMIISQKLMEYKLGLAAAITFTVTAATNVAAANAHGLSDTDIVVLKSSGTLPTGLATDTPYYVISSSANDFKLSATRGGSEIDITDTGSGTHSLYRIYSEGKILVSTSAGVTDWAETNPGGDIVGTTATQTVTNKTFSLASNTLAGTTAQFNSALSDGDFATLAGTETLTNKSLTSPVLTTPRIITSINDTNGNELIKVVAAASAVNEVTVANSATGNPVRQSATGDDTNIDQYLIGKGTGSARHAGPYDGWVAADETLTYASATTFTCSAALAGVLQTGDKIKLTQTTTKYFYVVSVSGTTITVTGGSDYTLANAAITSPFYSHEANPIGFPGFFNFAGAAAGFSALTTASYKFQIHGKYVHYTVALDGTSNSTGLTLTAPIASKNTAGLTHQAAFSVGSNNGANLTNAGRAYLLANSTAITCGPAPNSDTWTNANGKAAFFTLIYEIT